MEVQEGDETPRKVVQMGVARASIESRSVPKMQDQILRKKARNTLLALEYIKEDDIKDMVEALMKKAKAGNVGAARELLPYFMLLPRIADMLAIKQDDGSFELQIRTVG